MSGTLPPTSPSPAVEPLPRRGINPVDLAVMLGYLLLATVIFGPLWMDLGRGYLDHSMQDQHMWEWFFAVTADNIAHLRNPLFSDLQNHPAGVNLMANTVMLGVGVPLAPITLAFGPTTTWAIALTGGLAGTAAAWYWVISRDLVPGSRAGAAIGGAFCAFAPSIISHANAHPNFVVLFVLPFIVSRLVRLARGDRPVRDGVILGLLTAYQVFLGEESLLIAATTFAVFALSYAAFRPGEVFPMLRPLGIGVAVAAGVALLITAFPLWWQFFGPQGYGSLEHGLVGNDLSALTSFATESIAGDPEVAADLSMNRTEENAFFGWPLVILMLGVTVWLWRNAVTRALSVAMIGLAWLSLGAMLVVDGNGTAIPGPWLMLYDKPLYESVLESRFALGCVPVIGVLLAFATREAMAIRPARTEWRTPIRVGWFVVLAAALIPIAPTPLKVEQRVATPGFFADGTWRDFVDPGGSVMMAPLPDTGDGKPLSWQVDAGLEFPLAEGYFVGPGRDGRGSYGAIRRPTSKLLDTVGRKGEVPDITATERTDLLEDLRFWRADVIVLAEDRHRDELRDTVNRLLRKPGQDVGGAVVWDVRALTP